MPTERVQRQIDRLLDEAEDAIGREDWELVAARARAALRLDPDNADAAEYLRAAESAGSTDQPGPGPTSKRDSLPTSFAAGRYAVKSFLGEGARKRVYLAHDTRLGRDVALAAIKTGGLDVAGLTRVRNEGQAMARLGDHPNVVTVFDVGEDQGQPYMVSQYMGGGSLEDLIAKAEGQRLPLADTLRIAGEVCQALDHAHRQGVVHRDLKPGNVWLSSEGSAMLGDFGLAVALDRSRVTIAGMILGTVAYMPPEQALGGESTPRADLYSLGCMLYEMVTGRPPFMGEDPTAVISQHINTPPVAPSWLTDRCPPELEEVILRLLAKNPEDRPASAAEVREWLLKVDPEKKSQSHSDSSENPLDRLARGVFVGRATELEKLRKAFDDAYAGRGGLVILVGEPGIGKTRTTQELETYARMRGAQVLWGRTHEAAGAPAYWPWYQVGNQFAAANDIALIGPNLPPGSASELSRIFGWLRQQPGFVEPEPTDDPDAAQFRLFDAYASFVRAMAMQAPLVIALDDLHWADKPSLLLLQHLARDLPRHRVLIVGNYRDTDINRQSALTESLAVLNREPGFERIVLRGLSKEEVATYIRATANVEPRREVTDRIFEETEGNAFFLAEVVNLMAQEGSLNKESVSDIRIPDGVREALGRRLNRLSEDTNELLQIAAIIGREFTYDVLTILEDRDEDALLKLIEEGLEARVIEELSQPGRYRFTHAQMQETLLEELSTTRRVRLHGRVAEALERRWGEEKARERAPRLAQHFVEAATLTPRHADKALLYSRLAAEQAEQQLAWAEAVRHYEHCLTLLPEAPEARNGLEPELLVALGRSQRMALEPRAAWRNLMRAITLYREIGDAVGLARATLEATSVPTSLDRIHGLVQDALEVLGTADPYLEARLLLADMGQFAGPPEPGMLLRVEAIARTGNFPDVQASIAHRRGLQSFADLRFEDARREFNNALEVLVRYGRLTEAAQIAWLLGQEPLILGDVRSGKQALEGALVRVRALHVGVWEVNILGRLAGLALARGEKTEFAELLQQIVPNYARDLLQVNEAEIDGDLSRAHRLLPHVEAAGGVPPWAAHVHAARARISFALGDFDTATEELSDFLSDLERVGGRLVPFSIGTFFPTMEAGDALVLLGDEAATQIYDELVACEPVRWDPLVPRGADRIRGILALRLGRPSEAESHFRAGLEWARREGLRLEMGCCLLNLADLAEREGRKGEALQQLNEAITLFQQYGTRRYLDEALAMRVRLQGIGPGSRSIDAVAQSVQSEHPDLALLAAEDGRVTVFVSDIEDSTALNERLGDARWIEILREHNAIMRKHIADHRGHEVKTIGDAFMVVFADPLQAMRCAVDIQRDFAAWDAEPRIRVRVGLHAGQAVRDQGDFYGTNVTEAFRIAALGTGGQILVSSVVKELTEADGTFRFDRGRVVELKGISGRRRVFKVVWT